VLDSNTPLLGRDDERDVVDRWLRSDERALTVLGPAGVGKSTLVRRCVDDWIALVPDVRRVRVELASIARPEDALALIARAIDRPLAHERDAIGWIGEGLALVPTLLEVHDAERASTVLSAAISQWIELAPELRAALTSRVELPLGEGAQRVVRLAPLVIDADPEHAMQSAAVTMFVDRCARHGVTIERSAAVVALVRALDGLPLAIELAAARSTLMTPEAMLRWVHQPFELLRDPARTRRAQPHAALEHEIAATVALLDPPAQRAFAACAILRETITAESLADAGISHAIDALHTLRAASLVYDAEDAWLAMRGVRMLASIRAFAQRALEQRADREALADALAHAHARRAAEWLPALRGTHSDEAERAVLFARGDLIASAQRWIDRDAVEPALVLLHAVLLGSRRSYDPSGLDALIDAVEARLERAPLALQAMTRAMLAQHAMRVGRIMDAMRHAHLLSSVAEQSGEPRWIANALRSQGTFLALQGRHDEATALFERARAHAGSLHDELVWIERELAMIARKRGDWRRGIDGIERAIEHARAVHPRALADVLVDAAAIALDAGEDERAQHHLSRGEAAILEAHAERSRLPVVYALLRGRAAHARGAIDEAMRCYRESATSAQRHGDPMLLRASRLYEAIAVWESGSIRAAVERLREELAAMHALERTHWAWLAAMLGAGEAMLDNRISAQRAIDEAVAELRDSGAQAMALAAELCRGFVEDATRGAVIDQARKSPLASAVEVRITLRLLSDSRGDARVERRATVRVDPLLRWFAVDQGARASCAKRPTMRAILRALIEAHEQRPGTIVTRAQLLDAGWPHERMAERSAQRRIEVMISRMRELGLRDVLETDLGGYRLRADCVIER
jgi:tetratricopeptide (TPR) repeat protein